MVKHGSKKIRSKLNLNRKMKENKFENLENEVHELIKLSQQLKEVNEHLSKKIFSFQKRIIYYQRILKLQKMESQE